MFTHTWWIILAKRGYSVSKSWNPIGRYQFKVNGYTRIVQWNWRVSKLSRHVRQQFIGVGVHVFRPLIINLVWIWSRFYNAKELWINKNLLFDYFNYWLTFKVFFNYECEIFLVFMQIQWHVMKKYDVRTFRTKIPIMIQLVKCTFYQKLWKKWKFNYVLIMLIPKYTNNIWYGLIVHNLKNNFRLFSGEKKYRKKLIAFKKAKKRRFSWKPLTSKLRS